MNHPLSHQIVLSATSLLCVAGACGESACPAGTARVGSACRPVEDQAESGDLDASSTRHEVSMNADVGASVELGGDVNMDGDADSPSACAEACPPERSVCSVTGACEPCGSDGDCAHFADSPLCIEGACVACRGNADCRDPQASVCNLTTHRCQPCAADPGATGPADSDCQHLAATPICRAGTCVQCTASRRAACGADVCNALTHACETGKALRSANDCESCVSDAQCQTGQVCVQRFWTMDVPDGGTEQTELGWFCHWVKGRPGPAQTECQGPQIRPYVGDENVTSIDEPGSSFPICRLRSSTCIAHSSFTRPCGVYYTGADAGRMVVKSAHLGADDEPLQPSLDPDDIHPDDTLCGPGGKCVAKDQPAGAYQCTMHCTTTDDCQLPYRCVAQGSSELCTIN